MQVTSANAAPISWDAYAELQETAEKIQRLDHHSWGLDEQMEELLNQFVGGESTQSGLRSMNRVENLAANRAKKHRHRAKLLRTVFLKSVRGETPCDKFDALSNEESLNQVRRQVNNRQWEIFERLAAGDDYATIALEQRLTVSALKSRIARCRSRIRAVA
jgi:hypothetical protein